MKEMELGLLHKSVSTGNIASSKAFGALNNRSVHLLNNFDFLCRSKFLLQCRNIGLVTLNNVLIMEDTIVELNIFAAKIDVSLSFSFVFRK